MSRYDEYSPTTANKLLNPDGTVTTFAGEPIINPTKRFVGYTPIVNKMLNPDGSETTIPFLTPKSNFLVASDSTITISTDADNPSFLTGLSLLKSVGITLDPVDGKIRNNTNREISLMQGTVSFQPEKVDASTTLLYIWSERSLDGVVWTANAGSLRSLEIPGSGETFKTSFSTIRDFKAGEYLRFRAYANSAIDFTTPGTVSDGVTITGHSAIWELAEV